MMLDVQIGIPLLHLVLLAIAQGIKMGGQSDGAHRILPEEVTQIILISYTYTSGGLDGAGQSQSDAGC